ncbi:hypothetical protein B7953_06280 [Vibrio paracholerae]|uniref:Uncharacterized protein n=1 Tax=Vibrio paracholerae TaxID=650003 RepID=A0AAX1QS49_9VIBR|nr:hypothetical protein B7953_06280 [Vibrio paracholerae]PUA73219.1 hypothetical protein DB317_01590 [Vibrio cholerae]RBM59548.1 hypothetical protein DLR71_15925 [Vibrio paracholerae]RBM60001.1 hypothetical protein DLR67_09790 [Vibrio paracholerae]RBM80503.1 hypothetical protein DLR70_11665 [Vibrio paracholerae]
MVMHPNMVVRNEGKPPDYRENVTEIPVCIRQKRPHKCRMDKIKPEQTITFVLAVRAGCYFN